MSDGFWRRSRSLLFATALAATLVMGATAGLHTATPVAHAAAPASVANADCPQFPDFGQFGRDPTDAEIAQYSLPPKPHGAEGRKAWSAAMRALKLRVCDGDPGVNDPLLPRFYNGPARPTYGGVNQVPSHNYSGWAANTGNLAMDDAYAQWNAPCIPAGKDRGNKASSHWIGMGGWQNSSLLQVGTYSNDDGNGHPYYEAWVENCTAADGGATNVFSVSCGDQMYG